MSMVPLVHIALPARALQRSLARFACAVACMPGNPHHVCRLPSSRLTLQLLNLTHPCRAAGSPEEAAAAEMALRQRMMQWNLEVLELHRVLEGAATGRTPAA